jgi:anti-sigma B factor antagonist
VRLHATTINHGGALKLLHMTRRLSDLLVVTRLSTVFDSYESEAEAVAAFGK